MTEKFFDESGNEVEFEIVGKFEIDNKAYAVLESLDGQSTYILRIKEDKDGEYLEGIGDAELKEAIEAYEELTEKGNENGFKHWIRKEKIKRKRL